MESQTSTSLSALFKSFHRQPFCKIENLFQNNEESETYCSPCAVCFECTRSCVCFCERIKVSFVDLLDQVKVDLPHLMSQEVESICGSEERQEPCLLSPVVHHFTFFVATITSGKASLPPHTRVPHCNGHSSTKHSRRRNDEGRTNPQHCGIGYFVVWRLHQSSILLHSSVFHEHVFSWNLDSIKSCPSILSQKKKFESSVFNEKYAPKDFLRRQCSNRTFKNKWNLA